MQDRIIRAIADDGFVRIILAETTAAAEGARAIHGASPVAAAAMGRVLTATAMLASELKGGEGSITATVAGGGPIGKICAVARPSGTVKVYADDPAVESTLRADGKLNVAAAVGSAGKLTVVRDLGLREPWVGQVNLQSGEIAEDFALYLTASEQQPSLVSLGVLIAPEGTVLSAGGIIVQPLPGCPEETLVALEAAAPALGDISRKLRDGGAAALLETVFAHLHPQVVGELPVELRCDCSRERISRALITLGAAELDDMIREDNGAEVSCHFCNTKYQFTADDLERLKAASAG